MDDSTRLAIGELTRELLRVATDAMNRVRAEWLPLLPLPLVSALPFSLPLVPRGCNLQLSSSVQSLRGLLRNASSNCSLSDLAGTDVSGMLSNLSSVDLANFAVRQLVSIHPLGRPIHVLPSLPAHPEVGGSTPRSAAARA